MDLGVKMVFIFCGKHPLLTIRIQVNDSRPKFPLVLDKRCLALFDNLINATESRSLDDAIAKESVLSCTFHKINLKKSIVFFLSKHVNCHYAKMDFLCV